MGLLLLLPVSSRDAVQRWEGGAPKANSFLDPSTLDELGHVPEMGLAETKQAIGAAANAFVTWGKTTAKVCFSRYVIPCHPFVTFGHAVSS
jgi:hypothetical protein